MNITSKIIITDTNIITDLNNAGILDKFVKLDNVYISDMVKNDEIKNSTGNLEIIHKFKTISANDKQIKEIFKIAERTSGLSKYDIINFILAKDNKAMLATGDQKLKNFALANGVEVIRTLRIIRLMNLNNIISSKETIKACQLLKTNEKTRIPLDEIEKIINELKIKL